MLMVTIWIVGDLYGSFSDRECALSEIARLAHAIGLACYAQYS